MITIQLNLDTAQLQDSIVPIFANLDKDQIAKLVTDIVKEYLSTSPDLERKAYYDSVEQELAKSTRFSESSSQEIRRSYEFSKRVQDFKSVRTELNVEIANRLKEIIVSSVKNYIASDPKVNEIIKTTFEELVKNLPQVATYVMGQFFIEQFAEIAKSKEKLWGLDLTNITGLIESRINARM